MNEPTLKLQLIKKAIRDDSERTLGIIPDLPSDLTVKDSLPLLLKSFSQAKKQSYALGKQDQEFLQFEEFNQTLGDLLTGKTSLVVYVDSADRPFAENYFEELDHIIKPVPDNVGQWNLERRIIYDEPMYY